MIHFPYRISSKSDNYVCVRARPIFNVVMRTTTRQTTRRYFPQSLSLSFSSSDLHNLTLFFSVILPYCLYNFLLLLLLLSHNSSPQYEYRYIITLTFVTRVYKQSLVDMYVHRLKDCSFVKMVVCERQQTFDDKHSSRSTFLFQWIRETAI